LDEFTATLIYTQLDDFFKVQSKHLKRKGYGRLDSKCRLKDAKITLPEAACLLAIFQSSRVEHFKSFLDLWRPTLLRLFPKMPCYKRLCSWIPKAEQMLLDFVQQHLAKPGDRLARYALDSTKIDPHKDKNFPKCLRKATGCGKTHEGFFTGMKLHLLVDMRGAIVAADLSGGSRHDLDPIKGGMLKGVAGVVFADSGYVSAQVRQDLWSQDIALVAKPTKAMVDERWTFDRSWGKPGGAYRNRQVVEGVFSTLKRCFGLQARSVRSAASLRSRVWASLAAYLMLGKPASQRS
jgi:transposase